MQIVKRVTHVLIVVLTLLVMGWSALFNAAFDLVEHRLNGRPASRRPQWLRVSHAHSAISRAVS